MTIVNTNINHRTENNGDSSRLDSKFASLSIKSNNHLHFPAWVDNVTTDAGEILILPEWHGLDSNSNNNNASKDNCTESYRRQNGWHGYDFVHDSESPVRILEYYVKYGDNTRTIDNNNNNTDSTIDQSAIAGNGENYSQNNNNNTSGIGAIGGIGTALTGIVYFSARAESHAGYCHGGSICAALDDIIGWCAFCVTGECKPWSGFTVQVNTSLCKPVCVKSILMIKAVITKIERRKVYISADLVDPSIKDSEGYVVHAKGEGIVVMNRGVLSESLSRSSTVMSSFASNISDDVTK